MGTLHARVSCAIATAGKERLLICRVEFLEEEAARVAEHHESEKQLLVRQAEMQRQQYESQLKKVSLHTLGQRKGGEASPRKHLRPADAHGESCSCASVGLPPNATISGCAGAH